MSSTEIPIATGASLAPLRGADVPRAFTYTSIHTRLVAILREAKALGPETASAVRDLATALQREGGARILALPPLSSAVNAGLSSDAVTAFQEWDALVQARIDAGDTFDDAPWFWVVSAQCEVGTWVILRIAPCSACSP